MSTQFTKNFVTSNYKPEKKLLRITTSRENIKIKIHIIVKPINVWTLNLVQYLKIDFHKWNSVCLTWEKKAFSHIFLRSCFCDDLENY